MEALVNTTLDDLQEMRNRKALQIGLLPIQLPVPQAQLAHLIIYKRHSCVGTVRPDEMTVTPGRPQADSAGDGPGSGRTGPPARAWPAAARFLRERPVEDPARGWRPQGRPAFAPPRPEQWRRRRGAFSPWTPAPALHERRVTAGSGPEGLRVPGGAPCPRSTASPLPRPLGAQSAPVGSGRSHFGGSGDKDRDPIADPSRPRPRS